MSNNLSSFGIKDIEKDDIYYKKSLKIKSKINKFILMFYLTVYSFFMYYIFQTNVNENIDKTIIGIIIFMNSVVTLHVILYVFLGQFKSILSEDINIYIFSIKLGIIIVLFILYLIDINNERAYEIGVSFLFTVFPFGILTVISQNFIKSIYNKFYKNNFNLFVLSESNIAYFLFKDDDIRLEQAKKNEAKKEFTFFNENYLKMKINSLYNGFLDELKKDELKLFFKIYVEVMNSNNETIKQIFITYLEKEFNSVKKLNFKMFYNFYNEKLNDNIVYEEKVNNYHKKYLKLVNDDYFNPLKNKFLSVISKSDKQLYENLILEIGDFFSMNLDENKSNSNSLIEVENKINKLNVLKDNLIKLEDVNNMLLNVKKKQQIYMTNENLNNDIENLIETNLNDRYEVEFFNKISIINQEI